MELIRTRVRNVGHNATGLVLDVLVLFDCRQFCDGIQASCVNERLNLFLYEHGQSAIDCDTNRPSIL